MRVLHVWQFNVFELALSKDKFGLLFLEVFFLVNPKKLVVELFRDKGLVNIAIVRYELLPNVIVIYNLVLKFRNCR